MQPAEAIGILRGDLSPASVMHRGIAEKMGAEALEAWAWVERTGEIPWEHGSGYRVLCLGANGKIGAGYGPTPLLAVLDAMEKEGKG